jgi:hypothetical protein
VLAYYHTVLTLVTPDKTKLPLPKRALPGQTREGGTTTRQDNSGLCIITPFFYSISDPILILLTWFCLAKQLESDRYIEEPSKPFTPPLDLDLEAPSKAQVLRSRRQGRKDDKPATIHRVFRSSCLKGRHS